MAVWMVVEDEQDINNVILSMFEVWGMSGLSFTDGVEVADWIEDVECGRTHKRLPELALIDIRLPHIAGIELATKIRASRRLHNMALVLMTAYRLQPKDEQRIMLDTQADMLVYKPLPSMLPLRDMLERVLHKRKVREPRVPLNLRF